MDWFNLQNEGLVKVAKKSDILAITCLPVLCAKYQKNCKDDSYFTPIASFNFSRPPISPPVLFVIFPAA